MQQQLTRLKDSSYPHNTCQVHALGYMKLSAIHKQNKTCSCSLNHALLLQATYYGKDGDNQGACSFGASKANSMGLPWSTGTSLTVAVNDFQFADGLSCGMCVKFRGVGTGIGTEPLPQQWQYAVVTNK